MLKMRHERPLWETEFWKDYPIEEYYNINVLYCSNEMKVAHCRMDQFYGTYETNYHIIVPI